MKNVTNTKELTLRVEGQRRHASDIVINTPSISMGQFTISSEPGWSTWAPDTYGTSGTTLTVISDNESGLRQCWYTACVMEHLHCHQAEYTTITCWAAIYCALLTLAMVERNDAAFCRWVNGLWSRDYKATNLSAVLRRQHTTDLHEWLAPDARVQRAHQAGLALLSAVEDYRQQRLRGAMGDM